MHLTLYAYINKTTITCYGRPKSMVAGSYQLRRFMRNIILKPKHRTLTGKV